MLADLDRLMADDGVDALVVVGPMVGNPDLAYVARGAAILYGPVVKRRGEAPVAVVHPMEADEAAAAGLEVATTSALGIDEIHLGATDRFDAVVATYARIFERLGVGGRVQFGGIADASEFVQIVEQVRRAVEGWEPVRPTGVGLLARARITKDAAEVERMRSVAERTCRAMGEAIERLRTARVETRGEGDVLVDAEGVVTIGAVKARLGQALAAVGLSDRSEAILAQGADAAVAHSRGQDEAPLRAGVPTVFDLFPVEMGGGYHCDVCRSFCLGRAPDGYEETHRLVADVLDEAKEACRPDRPTREVAELVCERFEGAGVPTRRSDPGTSTGFYHALGHGIGLSVHEAPMISEAGHNRSTFERGMVFCLEPGLYDAGEAMGIRIEDVCHLRADGALETMTRSLPIEAVIAVGQ